MELTDVLDTKLDKIQEALIGFIKNNLPKFVSNMGNFESEGNGEGEEARREGDGSEVGSKAKMAPVSDGSANVNDTIISNVIGELNQCACGSTQRMEVMFLYG